MDPKEATDEQIPTVKQTKEEVLKNEVDTLKSELIDLENTTKAAETSLEKIRKQPDDVGSQDKANELEQQISDAKGRIKDMTAKIREKEEQIRSMKPEIDSKTKSKRELKLEEMRMNIIKHPNVRRSRISFDINGSSDEEELYHTVTPTHSNTQINLSDSDDDMRPYIVVQHPKVNLMRDPIWVARFQPKCDYVKHPNMMLHRNIRFRSCIKPSLVQKSCSASALTTTKSSSNLEEQSDVPYNKETCPCQRSRCRIKCPSTHDNTLSPSEENHEPGRTPREESALNCLHSTEKTTIEHDDACKSPCQSIVSKKYAQKSMRTNLLRIPQCININDDRDIEPSHGLSISISLHRTIQKSKSSGMDYEAKDGCDIYYDSEDDSGTETCDPSKVSKKKTRKTSKIQYGAGNDMEYDAEDDSDFEPSRGASGILKSSTRKSDRSQMQFDAEDVCETGPSRVSKRAIQKPKMSEMQYDVGDACDIEQSRGPSMVSKRLTQKSKRSQMNHDVEDAFDIEPSCGPSMASKRATHKSDRSEMHHDAEDGFDIEQSRGPSTVSKRATHKSDRSEISQDGGDIERSPCRSMASKRLTQKSDRSEMHHDAEEGFDFEQSRGPSTVSRRATHKSDRSEMHQDGGDTERSRCPSMASKRLTQKSDRSEMHHDAEDGFDIEQSRGPSTVSRRATHKSDRSEMHQDGCDIERSRCPSMASKRLTQKSDRSEMHHDAEDGFDIEQSRGPSMVSKRATHKSDRSEMPQDVSDIERSRGPSMASKRLTQKSYRSEMHHDVEDGFDIEPSWGPSMVSKRATQKSDRSEIKKYDAEDGCEKLQGSEMQHNEQKDDCEIEPSRVSKRRQTQKSKRSEMQCEDGCDIESSCSPSIPSRKTLSKRSASAQRNECHEDYNIFHKISANIAEPDEVGSNREATEGRSAPKSMRPKSILEEEDCYSFQPSKNSTQKSDMSKRWTVPEKEDECNSFEPCKRYNKTSRRSAAVKNRSCEDFEPSKVPSTAHKSTLQKPLVSKCRMMPEDESEIAMDSRRTAQKSKCSTIPRDDTFQNEVCPPNGNQSLSHGPSIVTHRTTKLKSVCENSDDRSDHKTSQFQPTAKSSISSKCPVAKNQCRNTAEYDKQYVNTLKTCSNQALKPSEYQNDKHPSIHRSTYSSQSKCSSLAEICSCPSNKQSSCSNRALKSSEYQNDKCSAQHSRCSSQPKCSSLAEICSCPSNKQSSCSNRALKSSEYQNDKCSAQHSRCSSQPKCSSLAEICVCPSMKQSRCSRQSKHSMQRSSRLSSNFSEMFSKSSLDSEEPLQETIITQLNSESSCLCRSSMHQNVMSMPDSETFSQKSTISKCLCPVASKRPFSAPTTETDEGETDLPSQESSRISCCRCGSLSSSCQCQSSNISCCTCQCSKFSLQKTSESWRSTEAASSATLSSLPAPVKTRARENNCLSAKKGLQEPKSTIEGASSTNSCHCSSISANKSSKSSAICSQKTTQNQTLISESGNRIPCEENINERKSRKTAVRETIEICPMDKNDKPSAISGTQTKKSHNSRVPERENNNKDSVRRTNRKSRRPSSCLLNAQEHARDLSATSGQSDDGDLHHQKSRPKRPLTRKRKQESIINKESAPSVPSYETKDKSNDRVSNQLSVASKRSKSLQENGTGCKSSSFVSSSCVIKSEPQNSQASNKSRNNNNGNYSKKYLKIKYEFDLQNCIVDKAHREFKEMTKMEFSPQELDDAKMKLISEFKKLRAMIAYAMWEQRRCKNENWGPLSISNVDETSVDLLKKDASELNKLEPPMIPSDISNASGYSKFEELMANEDISSLNKLENKNKQLEDLRSKAVMMRKDMFELYEENKRIACMLNESVAVSCPLEPCVNDVSHRLEGTDTNEDYSAQELHQLRTDLKILRTEMDQLKQGGIACHDSDDDDGMQEKISAINSLKMKLECSMAEMKSDIKKMRRND